MLTRQQVKMGRAALGWGVRDLAEKAGVTANTISRFENGADAYGETLNKIQRALEAEGIIFLPVGEYSGTGGPGVRLKSEG